MKVKGEAMPRTADHVLPGEFERLGVKPFVRNVTVGHVEKYPVLVKVKWDGRRLSLQGVVGPWNNGDAAGSSGQIVHELLRQDFRNAPGIDAVTLAAYWKRWHLNDTRPGCEHQQDWPVDETIEVVKYRLTDEACRENADLRKAMEKTAVALAKTVLEHRHNLAAVAQGLVAMATKIEHAQSVLSLPYRLETPPDADSLVSGRYEVRTRERRIRGHVSLSTHDQGLLGKPCATCGHVYGSKWLREEVPVDVLQWLANLPEDPQWQSSPWRVSLN